MSPITKRPGYRRTLPPPPVLCTFINQVLAADQQSLSNLLDSLTTWRFPKGDLYQWVEVLDKCDSHLEFICDTYKLKKVQRSAFSSADKILLISIIRFSVFLLDHCANRSLYASANNINDLLNTTDLDVLQHVARIALRLAQRGSHQRTMRNNFPLSQEKLWKLTTSLQYASASDGLQIVPMHLLLEKDAAVIHGLETMTFNYYNANIVVEHEGSLSEAVQMDSTEQTPVKVPPRTASPSSPIRPPPLSSTFRQTGRSNENVSIILTAEQLASNTLEKCFCDILEQFSVPEDLHYDLVLRMRFVKYAGHISFMTKMVNIRILAVAALANVVSENVLQSRLFTTEATLVSQLAKLLSMDMENAVPRTTQTASLEALEAIAHHRTKLGDVLNVLGVSLSHGLAMQLFRKSLEDLHHETDSSATDFLDAQISLLHYLSTTNIAGSLLCSAGLIQILVRFIKACPDGAIRILVKSLNLLDHLVYGFPQAFQNFCQSNGVAILVSRISLEIEEDLFVAESQTWHQDAANIDYKMTHEKFSLLKTMLKFVVHMMQTSGTSDGLRNLIESSLLAAIKQVFSNVDVFGSSIFASSTNIMTTFVHNEPTSYQILQEASLPETFLATVSLSILPASDALSCVPNAFGAICLNSQGLELFRKINPLRTFFRVFTSTRHCEIMRDSDIAGLLGSSFDELIRHHPSLKNDVVTGILKILEDINTVDRNHKDSTETVGAFLSFGPSRDIKTHSSGLEFAILDEDGINRSPTVLHVDIVARFLEGFLQNWGHAQEFLDKGGAAPVLKLYGLHSLSYDFAKSHAALSLSHVLRLACEINPPKLLSLIFLQVQQAMLDLGDFINWRQPNSFFLHLLDSSTEPEASTSLIEKFRIAHSLCVLLSDLYVAPIVSHGRGAMPFYQILAPGEQFENILELLGDFHRKVIWEEIKLSDTLSPACVRATQPKDDSKWPGRSEPQNSAPEAELVELGSDRLRDIRMVRFFLCQIPPCIVPFLQGLSKLAVNGRRTPDIQQRELGHGIADNLATVLVGHLTWAVPHDSRPSLLHSYYLMILTATQMMFCDEKSILVTSILAKFRLGTHLLSQILLHSWQDLLLLEKRPSYLPGDNDEKSKLSAIMKLILHMFQQFTSAKAVLNSPQSLFLESKDRLRNKVHFDSKQLLCNLKAAIVPSIIQIWNSQYLRYMPNSILSNVIVVLGQTLSVEKDLDDYMETPANDESTAWPLEFISITEPEIGNNTRLTLATDSACKPEELLTKENKTLREIAEEVRSACELVRRSLGGRVVEILNLEGVVVHPIADLIFNIMEFDLTESTWASDIQILLTASLESFEVQEQDSVDKKRHFNAIAHLLAKLTHNPGFRMRCAATLTELSQSIARILEAFTSSSELHNPVGIVSLVVAFDGILSDQETPNSFRSDVHNAEAISEAFYTLDKSEIHRAFSSALFMLNTALDKGMLLSLIRFLVRCTRDATFSQEMLSNDVLKTLLAVIRRHIDECDENLKTTILVLLRNIKETPILLETIFRNEISSWFHKKSRAVDISTYVRQNMALALRNPHLFVAITKEICHFPNYNPGSSLQAIALKNDSFQIATGLTEVKDGNHSLTTDNDSVNAVTCQESSVIHYLLQALFSLDGRVNNSENAEIAVTGDATMVDHENQSDVLQDTFLRSRHPQYLYNCFLLQALTELLMSYSDAKLNFLNYQFQNSAQSNSASKQEPRTAISSFLQQLLIKTLVEMPNDHITLKKRYSLEMWVKGVLVATCSSTSDSKDSSGLQHIQISILDTVHSTMKHLAIEPVNLETRYRGMVALADLIQRLLSTDPTFPDQDASRKALTRLMLQKSFVGLLAQTISSINMQHPIAKKVVKALLRPLRTLTKAATRMPEISESDRIKQEQDSNLQSGFEAEAAMVDVGSGIDREETPDLYRNSALGMFGPEIHESEDESLSSEDDEEM